MLSGAGLRARAARRIGWLAAAMLLGIAPQPATAEQDGDAAAASPAGGVEIRHRLTPRAVREDCFEAPSGGHVTYAFESSAVVTFNVHHHVGDETIYDVESHEVTEANRSVPLPAPGRYCLMYTNAAKRGGYVHINGSYQVIAPGAEPPPQP
ncbi:MAG: hypothetical protein VX681_08715 [Myxococcota bacterium]|nr:hypothetical protein [Myxococcota bacterium]